MIILGISSWFHDSSACLLRDGEIIAYVEEERFNREKHSPGYPQHSIDWVLGVAEIGLDDVDEVVFYLNPIDYLKVGLKTVLASFPNSLALLRKEAATVSPLRRLREMYNLKSTLCQRHGASGNFKVVFLDHYRTHQGSTFFASGFDESAVLTMDFAGDGRTEVIAHGVDREIRDKLVHRVPVGFALIYTTVTHVLGFKWWDEYKIMGMAAYGKPVYVEQIKQLFNFDEDSGALEFNMQYFNFHKYGRHRMYSDKIFDLFGRPPEPGAELSEREYDLAASLQAVTAEYGVAMARLAKKLTGSNNLCMAGGVAQNCLMNQAICESGLFENVFLQPLAGDVGCTLGAVLYRYHAAHGHARRYKMEHLYLGPSYVNESHALAEQQGLVARECDDWQAEVAKAIADGNVVGFFDGKMEVGPRALGARSIMADPRRQDMKDILNSRVKHREHFRPFAPSILDSELESVFEALPSCRSSDFMIVTMNVREEWRDKLPAITHADGSARVQTVRREYAANYYGVIKKFFELTGVPLVVNTSFNDNEPIVCTPTDAINCFKRTQIDLLVLDGKLYFRADNADSVEREPVAV